jgi:hypothetical protein
VKKNIETLTDATKEVGLKIKVEITNYMLLSRQQNVDQNRDIKVANRLFENVSQFEYLGRQNSGNACYHSVQNLLSSRLLSKKHTD